MFILEEKDVKICSVIREGQKNPAKIRGIFYRGFLFIQVASYPHSRYDHGVKQCRQLLEADNTKTIIIVKTSNAIELWSHNSQLKIVENQESNLIRKSFALKNLTRLVANSCDLQLNSKMYQQWDLQAKEFWQEATKNHSKVR